MLSVNADKNNWHNLLLDLLSFLKIVSYSHFKIQLIFADFILEGGDNFIPASLLSKNYTGRVNSVYHLSKGKSSKYQFLV